MKHTLLILSMLGVTSIAMAAFVPAQQQAVPATPAIVGPNGDVPWHSSLDIGNGVELETFVGFTDSVARIDTGTVVRPLSLHLNFTFGTGVMAQMDHLKLYPIADTTPIEFRAEGVDRNVVVSQRPPFDDLSYLVTYTPKAGFSWGTIQGIMDVDISVVQL